MDTSKFQCLSLIRVVSDSLCRILLSLLLIVFGMVFLSVDNVFIGLVPIEVSIPTTKVNDVYLLVLLVTE